jgi:hypothetical protein
MARTAGPWEQRQAQPACRVLLEHLSRRSHENAYLVLQAPGTISVDKRPARFVQGAHTASILQPLHQPPVCSAQLELILHQPGPQCALHVLPDRLLLLPVVPHVPRAQLVCTLSQDPAFAQLVPKGHLAATPGQILL